MDYSQMAPADVRALIRKGEITGPTTGVLILTLDEIRVYLKPVDTVRKGESFSIAVPSKIRPSDKLYFWRPL